MPAPTIPASVTRGQWLTVYESELRARFPYWADDDTKRARFLASATATLNGATTWNHDGPAVVAAWRALGGKGTPTLKALRALPL